MALMLVSLSTWAQEKAKDTVQSGKTQRYGVRVGVDLHRLAKSFYDDNYKGFEIVGDYRLTKKNIHRRRTGQRKENG